MIKVDAKQPNSKSCFVCGLENPLGLKARFYELENGDLVSLFKPSDMHQSYPGRLHGGLAATILDETIGRAVMIKGQQIWGVTIDFSIRFRRPVSLDNDIMVIARMDEVGRRTFMGSGYILDPNGKVAVEGKGKYLKMDLDKIADFDHNSDEWQVVNGPDEPLGFDY